jgi:hypothetical protein
VIFCCCLIDDRYEMTVDVCRKVLSLQWEVWQLPSLAAVFEGGPSVGPLDLLLLLLLLLLSFIPVRLERITLMLCSVFIFVLV